MSIDYVERKFSEAIYSLIGAAPIQTRLAGAALHLIVLDADELPRIERAAFVAVMHCLTKYPAEHEDEGTIHASTRRLTPDEGAEISRSIFGIYKRMTGGM